MSEETERVIAERNLDVESQCGAVAESEPAVLPPVCVFPWNHTGAHSWADGAEMVTVIAQSVETKQ